MKIICMGDSITYGHGLTDLSRRWSDLTAARTGHTLINLGVNGDTTGGMLSRCQTQVFPQTPNAMVLLGGINDINLTGDYRFAKVNMTAILQQAAAIGLPVIVGIPLPVVPEDMAFLNWDNDRNLAKSVEECQQYAQWLQALCTHKGMPVADFRSPFLQSDGTVRRELFQDGLHPTAAGHALMADVLCRVLTELFPG